MAYEIGSRIRKYRMDKNLSQKDFAALLDVSASRVNNWENGVNRPDVDILVAICKTLSVSPSDLLDVHLNPYELTEHEKQLITNYRTKSNMQEAVNILLGLDNN